MSFLEEVLVATMLSSDIMLIFGSHFDFVIFMTTEKPKLTKRYNHFGGLNFISYLVLDLVLIHVILILYIENHAFRIKCFLIPKFFSG